MGPGTCQQILVPMATAQVPRTTAQVPMATAEVLIHVPMATATVKSGAALPPSRTCADSCCTVATVPTTLQCSTKPGATATMLSPQLQACSTSPMPTYQSAQAIPAPLL